MIKIIFNVLRIFANHCVRTFTKPFLSYKIGQNFPFIKKIYGTLYNLTKPKMVNVFGQWLILHQNDQVFANEIISTGTFEDTELKMFLSFLQENMVIFDIGANIGYYTILAASRVGSHGQIYAFEPDKENFAILKNNVELNQHSNVKLLQLAVSDECGYLELNISLDNKGDHRTRKTSDLNIDRKSYKVKSITIDSFCDENNVYPDVIKMDIQGFEYFAILGMMNLLTQTQDLVLLIELWPYGLNESSGLDTSELLYKQLENFGFVIFNIDENSKKVSKINNMNEILMSLQGEAFTNLLCLKGKYYDNYNDVVLFVT